MPRFDPAGAGAVRGMAVEARAGAATALQGPPPIPALNGSAGVLPVLVVRVVVVVVAFAFHTVPVDAGDACENLGLAANPISANISSGGGGGTGAGRGSVMTGTGDFTSGCVKFIPTGPVVLGFPNEDGGDLEGGDVLLPARDRDLGWLDDKGELPPVLVPPPLRRRWDGVVTPHES